MQMLSKPRILEGTIGNTLAYALLPKELMKDLPEDIQERVNQFPEGEAKRMFQSLTIEQPSDSPVTTRNSITQILQEYSEKQDSRHGRMNASFACEDLRGLDFQNVHSFEGAFFPYAHLEDLDLSNKNLKDTVFTDAYIAGTSFTGSDISGASFINAKNLRPELFVKALNWREAHFFEDHSKDKQFKEEIVKEALRSR